MNPDLHLEYPHATATAHRLLDAALTIIVVYLAATLVPMGRYVLSSRDAGPLIAHATVLAAAGALLPARDARLRVIRDLFPLAIGAFLYVELRWLIPGTGRVHADVLVQGWEAMVFPGNPAVTWASRMPLLLLSEAFHVAYASYYLIVLLPPLVLYARGRREQYAHTMLGLALVYAACFATYLVLPVDGPRYFIGPAAAPDGPARTFVLRLLEAGSSRGTAFPSSHVAASIVASLCALRFQRPVGIVVASLTLGLVFGTVYGGFHYGVDALAGVFVGLAAWWAASALCRALSTPGAQSATAA